MARSYGWSKRDRTASVAALVPGLDAEHLTPTANPEFPDQQIPEWASTVYQPALPVGMIGEPFGTPVKVGGGPIDRTPEDHSFGGGVAPGLTTLENQDVRRLTQRVDLGATAARRWAPITDRTDGPGPLHFIVDNTSGHGDSPATLELEQTGVDRPNDPYARLGTKWIKRSWDRFIDMHRWGVEYRPVQNKNAATAQTQPPVPSGGQYDSPAITPASFSFTPDKFVAPQERRTPVPWDQDITVDGSERYANAFGLASWGL